MPQTRQRAVQVLWNNVPTGHKDWHATRCLYAYLSPLRVEILYIGITWNQTIRARSSYSAKRKLWDFLNRDSQTREYIPLAGHIDVGPGRRRSKALLTDIESLLIQEIAPRGNV